MNQFIIAALIGIVAGAIDATPMIIMKMEKAANVSAFFHYFVLGLITPFVNWGIPGWITGMIISILSSIPIVIIVSGKDKKGIIPILVFSVILGAFIGYAGTKFIH